MPKDTEIEILFEDGQLTVKPPTDDDCTDGDPHRACGWKTHQVKWFSEPKERFWAVLIDGDSPFQHGKRLFTSKGGPKGGPIAKGKNKEKVKYWVFAQDDDGVVHDLDPIIVIRDDKDSGAIEPLQKFVTDLDAASQEAEEFATVTRELSETTRKLIPVMEQLLRRSESERQP